MKNTHLEHIEDEILNRGSKGGKDAIDFLEDIGKFLHQRPNEVNITTKWDGAPAIICGTDPETQKFFVGTKSVFNKTNAKVCYSNGDIDNYYTGQLASKLKACLRYLPNSVLRELSKVISFLQTTKKYYLSAETELLVSLLILSLIPFLLVVLFLKRYPRRYWGSYFIRNIVVTPYLRWMQSLDSDRILKIIKIFLYPLRILLILLVLQGLALLIGLSLLR